MVKMIKNLDIDDAVGRLRRINNSIAWIGSAIPEYPNEGGMDDVATILKCLSEHANDSISHIEKVAALV